MVVISKFFRKLGGVLLAVLCISTWVNAGDAELLVLMHDSGRVERYELQTGKHLGTLLSGLPPSNALLLDNDGRLLISTGKPNEMGTVLRYDLAGRVETLIQVPGWLGIKVICWWLVKEMARSSVTLIRPANGSTILH
jgi:hypothetical protein